jgi:two-component system phosphate regulon response regulator PhoB
MANKRLLLVEDDRALADLVTFHFERAGYDVTRTGDGEEALILVEEVRPDIILLDWMIEGISGIEVCRRLRRRSTTANVPIMMLTARGEESDRIRGFDTGADDYVTKPFSPREVVLRTQNLLRRLRADPPSALVRVDEFCLDKTNFEATVQGKRLELTATEFKLLAVLVERRGRVLSRETLLRDVWKYEHALDTRTVDTHVRRLREKLGACARRLITVRGEGYGFLTETSP